MTHFCVVYSLDSRLKVIHVLFLCTHVLTVPHLNKSGTECLLGAAHIKETSQMSGISKRISRTQPIFFWALLGAQRSLRSQISTRESRNVTHRLSLQRDICMPVFCPEGWDWVVNSLMTFVLSGEHTRYSPGLDDNMFTIARIFMEEVTRTLKKSNKIMS